MCLSVISSGSPALLIQFTMALYKADALFGCTHLNVTLSFL